MSHGIPFAKVFYDTRSGIQRPTVRHSGPDLESSKQQGRQASPAFSLQVINQNGKRHIGFHKNALQSTAGMTSLRRTFRRNTDQMPRSLLQRVPSFYSNSHSSATGVGCVADSSTYCSCMPPSPAPCRLSIILNAKWN